MTDSNEPQKDVSEKHREQMRALGSTLDQIFNGHPAVNGGRKKVGFCLLTYSIGDPASVTKMNFISNSNRQDMVRALTEFIAREKRGK